MSKLGRGKVVGYHVCLIAPNGATMDVGLVVEIVLLKYKRRVRVN